MTLSSLHRDVVRRCRFAAVALTLLAVAAPARATITPDARKVVDRYVDAIGGRALVDGIRTMRVVAHVSTVGLTGRTVTTTMRPDAHLSQTDLGPFHIPEGYDGSSGWHVDPSGKLLVLDGQDLEDAKAGAWFENNMWLAPDQGGGKVRVTGTDHDSLGTYTVLEVTPPVGRPRSYWFDTRTGLVARESMKHDQQVVTGSRSDYRKTAAGLVAFHELVRIADMPANDLVIDVDSVYVNEPYTRAQFGPPAAEAERMTWLATPAHAQVPFRYSARHVWVRASVNGGEPADFLFDTGASITILDSTYAAKLGLATEGEMQGEGAGSTGSARFSELKSLRILGGNGDGIEFAGQKVGVLSINPFLEPFFWRPCAGVIGADFISRVVTRIDYDHETLTFTDPKAFTYSGGGTAVPFVLAGNMPAVTMTIDGAYTGSFRVDVGSSSTVDLHHPFVARHQLAAKAAGRKLEVVGGGFGGTFTSTLTRMKTMTLGPYSWKDPMLSFSGAASGALASEDYAGNIGNQILQRFVCTFDYEHRRLYLEPSARFHERDHFSRAGVQLARYGDAVKAMQVLPGSPAARAGLAQGDEVTSIDSKPVLNYTADDLQRLFEDGKAGARVTLQAVHEGTPKTITLTLAEML